MPKNIIDLLHATLRQSTFKPDFAELRRSIYRKLLVSMTLASLAVFCGAATAADIDMDGIQDGVDIDDDNDGILDSVEGTLVPPTGPVASATYSYTPAGNSGNIGDTTLYPNAGSFNGISFDLRLTVVANSDPANLIIHIEPQTQAGITYPILLDGTPNTGTASIDFEFLISGTTTPMQVPSIYTWIDIDANEKLTVASNELSEYQLNNPTNISVSSAGGYTTFASNVSGGPADQPQWIRTTLLSNSKFTFQYDKRTGGTGYIWDISTYTNGAPPVVLNPEAFYAGDIDGDGIANSNDLDSDNDGISDLVESGTAQSNIMIDADSNGSVSLAEANAAMGAGLGDVDGDGLVDLFDADTASQNDLLSVGTMPVNTDGDAEPDYLDLDSEADGIPDTVEALPTAGYVANDGNVADQDTDLDGVVDLFDTNDGSTNDFGGTFTQPEDTDIDGTPDYLDTDSDADTINDSAEIATALAPTYADPDGSVSTTLASLQNTDSDTTDVDFRSLNDADGDGVLDVNDLNASDPCIPNMGGVPTTKDCDGDGNPVATDPDVTTPNASNDSGTAGATIDLLSNDDYLSNNDSNNLGTTSITAIATGTTCAGTPTFDASTGTLVYASAASETSGTCDLVYEVCNTAASALPVCTQATVTITLADTDGDGIPDDLDSDPADACVPNATGTPGSKDCDGDGNPVSSDPNPTAPNAANDTGVPGTPVNLLSNDDYLPNNDPANIGTTSISAVTAGTTCAGTPTFDATTGNMTYTPAASETSGSCDIAYQVCSTPTSGGTPVCSTAIVTMTLADTDGDGIPDNLDSDPADACVPNASGTPGSKDCDGDGNPASSDPNPTAPTAANDTGTPGAPIDLLSNDDFLPNNDTTNLGVTSITGVAAGTTCTGTSSFDATTGNMTYTPSASEISGTCVVEYEVCSTASTGGSAPVCETAQVTITLTDSDGDGIPDNLDSDPADACVPNAAGTPGSKDCDYDGNPASSDPDPSAPNAADDNGAPGTPINLLANDDFLPNNDPANLGTTTINGVASGTTCTGTSNFDATTGNLTYTPAAGEVSGTCIIEYQVCNTLVGSGTPVCETALVTITLADTDGDGIPDNLDSDPADACIPNVTGTPGSKDCDGDGNPASTDPDPGTPTAANDSGAPGTPIDLLANDDYLPNNDPANLGNTTITAVATGTTCAGSTIFDAATGSMTYTPAANEITGSCDVVYQVCNTPAGGGTPVCENATVTIALDDSDGDGIPDALDSDPADACVPNVSGTPGTKDCDGDGNPASSDPDPAAPDASHDAGAAGNPINILANDDYLPNNDPDVVGTTSITQVGGNCTGSVSLNANTGIAIYTVGAGDTAATCTVEYRVCSTSATSTQTCENAIITFSIPAPTVVPDTDGDGLADDVDSAPQDACVPNVAGTPGTKDCDGDGNPASTDPDPAAPDASNDAGMAGNPINILANDDYLPNNDPDVIGTTSITQFGGSCTGNVSLNANTGIANYTAAAGDTGPTCTVNYTVCSTSTTGTPTCEDAAIIFTVPTPTAVPDTDGDGLADDVDPAPQDACVPYVAGTPGTKDCDSDGNPASSDPDPAAPDASHDAGAAGNPINILANDDYLPNNNPDVIGTTSISRVGGNCIGNVTLNANNGMAIYPAGAGDTAATCTVEYEVCSASPTGTVTCENAIITFTIPAPTVVPDTDGDGIADDVDTAPTNACVPNATGTPGNKDCDGDGNPASSDPDAANPQAANDTGNPGVPIDILANDDFLPNNDSNNTGTTTLAHVGGTCSGNVALDANAGTINYTLGAGDTGANCTINYEVCSNSSGTAVCEQAVLVIPTSGGGNPNPNPNPTPSPVTDSDGDGIPDSVEGTGDTDGDGVPDYLDLDSDNDGLLDSTEMTEDMDNDGVPDYRDLDSDNDGLTDTLEAGGTDANGDGIVDGFIDTNNDGWSDNVAASPLPEPDFDGDGFVDYLDLDSDNDGLPDINESMGADRDTNNDGMIDNPVDANGDGLADNINANDVKDTDQDGAPDHLDLDSNNNGTFDLAEAGGNDVDNDGRVDTWQDDDNDGIPNSVDVDSTGGVDADSDGIDDSADASFQNGADTDGDGIIDDFDADRQGNGFTPFTTDSITTEQTANGDIRIGLQGGGCTIATNNASADPLLPLLMLLSMLCLNLRRRLSRIGTQLKRAQQNRNLQKLTWIVIASCALSSCSMIGLDRSNRYGNRSVSTNPDTQFRRHVYAGTGIGASWLEPDTSEVPGVDVNDRVNAAGQATLGVDISKSFSLELHSADLGSAGLHPKGRINYHMHGGSALLYVGKNRHNHVRRGLTGYGRLGYGTLDDSSIGDINYKEENNTHVLFGGGLEYATRSGLGLRAELISFDADAKYGQLGLVYRMGGKHRRAPARIAKAPPPAPAPEPVVIEQPVAPPPVPAVQVPVSDPCAQFTGVLEGVNFHTDSDRLTSQAEIILDGIANELALCPTTPIAISAHTDDQGSEQYNRGLSKRRALSVARYLSGRGVTTSRMSARAFGESRPIAPNTTSEGRASNRRVELVAQ